MPLRRNTTETVESIASAASDPGRDHLQLVQRHDHPNRLS